MRTQVLVRLRAPDPWSFTVLDTLRRKFGLGQVVGIARLKCWDVVFRRMDAGSALEATARVLRETALLANPNRDRWVLRGEADHSVPADFWHRSVPDSKGFAVKVTDRKDIKGRSIREILRQRLRMDEIEEVCFSTIWILEISADEPDPEGLARDISTARSWRHGLLSNPHCQNAEVRETESCIQVKDSRS
jgi:hypothetical protein